ncbi:MAG: twin-arginine translocation signal domain-containing protein, partial [Terriglobia bacterium]
MKKCPSRREFLKKSLGAAGLAGAARVAEAATPGAPSDPLRIRKGVLV